MSLRTSYAPTAQALILVALAVLISRDPQPKRPRAIRRYESFQARTSCARIHADTARGRNRRSPADGELTQA